MKGKEYYNKLAGFFDNTGYLNSSIRNPSFYYKHISNLIEASDNAMISMISKYPTHLVLSYMDSYQCSEDSEELAKIISCLDGARDIKTKAETFYSEKIDLYSQSEDFLNSEDKYIAISSKVPMEKSGNIIVEVDNSYKEYFNDLRNLKSVFNFLEYAEKQVGYPVSWEDDGYFVIHAPIDEDFSSKMDKILPKISVSDTGTNFADKYSKEINGKYNAILTEKAISLGFTELRFYVDDKSLPLELNDQIHVMERADKDYVKNFKIGDNVLVSFGFSKNNIRVNGVYNS